MVFFSTAGFSAVGYEGIESMWMGELESGPLLDKSSETKRAQHM